MIEILQLLFTWKRPQAINNGIESLEIRADGELLEASVGGGATGAIEESPARDFFTQFVNSDPVAAAAKLHYADNIPALLTGILETGDYSHIATKPTTSQTAEASSKSEKLSKIRRFLKSYFSSSDSKQPKVFKALNFFGELAIMS